MEYEEHEQLNSHATHAIFYPSPEPSSPPEPSSSPEGFSIAPIPRTEQLPSNFGFEFGLSPTEADTNVCLVGGGQNGMVGSEQVGANDASRKDMGLELVNNGEERDNRSGKGNEIQQGDSSDEHDQEQADLEDDENDYPPEKPHKRPRRKRTSRKRTSRKHSSLSSPANDNGRDNGMGARGVGVALYPHPGGPAPDCDRGARAWTARTAQPSQLSGPASDIILGLATTSSKSLSSNEIAETFHQLVSGEAWAAAQYAFRVDSLESIVARCLRAEAVEHGVQFMGMINFITLAAKLERCLVQFHWKSFINLFF